MSIQPVHCKGLLRRLISVALAAILLSPISTTPQIVHADGPFVVNTTFDYDPGTLDGFCNNGTGGVCGLREAIAEAFGTPNTTITFSSSLAGQTIYLSNLPGFGPLAVHGTGITVDGESNDITISGSALVSAPAVIQVDGDNNTIRNLTIRDSPWDGIQVGDLTGTGTGNGNTLDSLIIIHNGMSGIYFAQGDSNRVQMTLIGTMSNSAPACLPAESNNYGIYVANGASNTTIGGNVIVCNLVDGISVNGIGGTHDVTIATNGLGTNANDSPVGNQYAGIAVYGGAQHVMITGGNSISGNGRQGIYIAGAGTADIQIFGNRIGTNRYGTAAVPNLQPGIMVDNVPSATSANIRIGGNTISGNGTAGIWVKASSNVIITGNQVGTNADGTAAIPNGSDGIYLSDGAQNNHVGGTDETARNIISGNALSGIHIQDGSTGNTIDGNTIGLNAAGSAALPNGGAGIAVMNANNNQIGSASGLIQQYISANEREGIYVGSSSGTTIAQDNFIGTGSSFSTLLGNGLQGVMLAGTTNTLVWPSSIAYNGGAGVALTGSSAAGNNILPSLAEANGGLPVDLGNDGPTPNNPADGTSGPNLLLHYPTINTVTGGTVQGSACSNCTVQIYHAIGNPAAAFGGGKYLTSSLANASGSWSFALSDGETGSSLTMIAVDTASPGNTSEFSPRPLLFLPVLKR